MDEVIQRMEKNTQKAIKRLLCENCGGVRVRSYMSSLASIRHGKRCECNG